MELIVQLTEEQAEILGAFASRTGRSIEAVVRDAVRKAIAEDEHRARVLDATQDVVARYGEALRRLGDS